MGIFFDTLLYFGAVFLLKALMTQCNMLCVSYLSQVEQGELVD